MRCDCTETIFEAVRSINPLSLVDAASRLIRSFMCSFLGPGTLDAIASSDYCPHEQEHASSRRNSGVAITSVME
jgi:hypothetical protein